MHSAESRYSLSKARAIFANLVARASLGGERFRMSRRAIDVAAMIGPQDIAALEQLDQEEGHQAKWNPYPSRSPRAARDELADKLANVEVGERVLIEKRGRGHAALIPIADLDRLEHRSDADELHIRAYADSNAELPAPQLPWAKASAVLARRGGREAVVAELNVRADPEDAASDAIPVVRCTHNQPANHEAIAEAIRLAAHEHSATGERLPAGFSYKLDLSNSRTLDGASLAGTNLEMEGESVQAPAFVAAAMSLMRVTTVEVLATGALGESSLGSIGEKLKAAIDRKVGALIVPAQDLGSLHDGFAEAGWSWNEDAKVANGPVGQITVLAFSSPADLYAQIGHLCGAISPGLATPVVGPNTMGALWRAALGNEHGAVEQAFLEFLAKRLSDAPGIAPALDAELTPLQERFHALCRNPRVPHPFTSERHLLISGGTSSGKTTVLEMLAVATALRTDRNKALYLAPTRALAQIKHRELIKRYSGFEAFGFNRPIILATGEDNDDDWRFHTADFSIAVLVTEKANVLAQVQRNLIDQIGLIVIDEGHMLSDTDRGPILEMFQLKTLERRREQEGRIEYRGRQKLRVAIISTEAVDQPAARPAKLARPIAELLTETRQVSGEKLAPIVVTQPLRPGKIKHWLILPAGQHAPFQKVWIADFQNAVRRTLSREQLTRVDTEIKISQKALATDHGLQALREMMRRKKSESSARLHNLLNRLAAEYAGQTRYILIFAPSMASIISSARRLLKTLNRRHCDHGLGEVFEGMEDESERKNLKELAQSGIYIHHSGIDRAVRDRIAQVWGERRDTGQPHFLFATETLSFGVNLAIDDVVMYGTSAFASARNRDIEGGPLPYTSCEFHNMIGRAGRLGLDDQSKPSNVFILPLGDSSARAVIDRYYTHMPALESRLFVEDDVVREGRADLAKRLNNISHPFVHAMLDLLRFVAPLDASVTADSATVDDLMAVVERGSLFFRQLSTKPHSEETKRRFRNSLEAMLDGCAAEDKEFRLVDRRDGGKPHRYRITQKGTDVLDTGTEIQTLQPLVKLARLIEKKVWQEHAPAMSPMPGELAMITVIAQRECYRPVQNKLVEARLDENSVLGQENVDGVFEDFKAEFTEHIPGGTREMADALRDLLVQFFREANLPTPALRCAGVLRLSSMMFRWIEGKPQREVRIPVEKLYPQNDRRPFSANHTSYAERLSWKLELLMRLLAPEHEIQLAEMIERVRLGCPADAVTLKKALPVLRRRRATMLAEVSGPQDLLRRPSDPAVLSTSFGIHTSEAAKLRTGLYEHYVGQFRELISVLCSRAMLTPSAFVDMIGEYGGANGFGVDVKAFADLSSSFVFEATLAAACDEIPDSYDSEDEDYASFDLIEPKALWTGAEGREVRLETDKRGGFTLSDQLEVGSTETRFLVVGAREYFGVWTASSGDRRLAALLEEERDTARLVLGVTPWLPDPGNWPREAIEACKRRKEAGQETLIITAPAFCALIIMLARKLGTPEDLLYQGLVPGKVSLMTIHSIRKRLVRNPDLPAVIRRAMAKFQEVGTSIPEI